MIRKSIRFGCCGLIGVMIVCSPSATQTTGGKKDDLVKANQQLQKTVKDQGQTIQKLEAQIQNMKLFDAQQQGKIVVLQQRVGFLEGKKKGTTEKSAAQLRKDLDKANQALKDKDQLIASLQQSAPSATADLAKEVERLRKTVRQLELIKKAPYVHSLILKLKKDDDEQISIINLEASKTLGKIPGVRGLWVGKPVESSSPGDTQKEFQLGLVVLLDDADTLKKFLDDPLQKQFQNRLADFWHAPVVYDFQRETEAAKKDDVKKKDAE